MLPADKNLLKGGKVMLICERQLTRELLVSALKQVGAGATVHGVAHEMLQRAPEFKPALIFCEFAMEPLDGAACLHHMKQHKIEVPVIMLVHKGDSQAEAKARAMGARQIVQVPFAVTDIIKAVDKVVNGEPKRRELYFGD
jgi:DNA-binding NtrC family response regulator